MGRMYVANFTGTAFTAAFDAFEILAPSAKVVKIHGWELFQTTELGDAAEEILRIETTRGVGSVTSGSGGATPTAQPIDNGDGAFGGTVESNNTTRMAAGTGSLEVLTQHGWNVRVPLMRIYTPEERPVITPGERWTLGCASTPADSITVGGTVTFEEIG